MTDILPLDDDQDAHALERFQWERTLRRKPLPPDQLADALQDSVHIPRGIGRPAVSVKVPNPMGQRWKDEAAGR